MAAPKRYLTPKYPNNGTSQNESLIQVIDRFIPTQGGIEQNVSLGTTLLYNDASIIDSSNVDILYPLTPLLTDPTFDNSIYNALINNFNENRLNSFLMDVDYLNSPTIPVNQKLLIEGKAKKAQVPDSNYTSLQVITPRYLGSKVTSANYNFPTPAGRVGPNTGRFNKRSVLPQFLNGDIGNWAGDSSYGNTAAIDKNPIYFAHFKQSSENLNLPGTYTFNIDSLIEAPFDDVLGKDFFPKIIKIDGSNDNLSTVSSNFETERKSTVTYDITTKNGVNYSRLPVGSSIIYQGGAEFDNILWNISNDPTPIANPNMSFNNDNTTIVLAKSSVSSYFGTFTTTPYSLPYKSDRFFNQNPFTIQTTFGTQLKRYKYFDIDANTWVEQNNVFPDPWNEVYGTDISNDTPIGNASSTWLVTGSVNLLNNLSKGTYQDGGVNEFIGGNEFQRGDVGSMGGTLINFIITASSFVDNGKGLTISAECYIGNFLGAKWRFATNPTIESFTGSWGIGDEVVFPSQSLVPPANIGSVAPNGKNLILKLRKENFEDDRAGVLYLGGPALTVSGSAGSQTGNNVFTGTALTVIHTVNKSIKNQTPYLSMGPDITGTLQSGITVKATQSFGIADQLNIDPNDLSNYITYNVSQSIEENKTPGDLITNSFIPREAVEPGFNITGSSGFKVKALVPDVNGDVRGNFYFEDSQSLSPKEGQQPSFFNPTRQFEVGEVITFSSQSLGAIFPSGSDLQIPVTEDLLENIQRNNSLSGYKNTNEPFLIERGDEIKIKYSVIINGVNTENNATFQVLDVPNNGFDDGTADQFLTSSLLLDGEYKKIANTVDTRKNMLYESYYRRFEFTPGFPPTIVNEALDFYWKASTNCFDKILVTPNPADLNPQIPEGKINNVQITRRVNADDRVILFQNSPPNSQGTNTPSGPGFLIPNDLTSIQKRNVESLISLLNAKNTFKNENLGNNDLLSP